MAIEFQSQADGQVVYGLTPKSYKPRWVTITLEDNGRLTIVETETHVMILDTHISQIQRLSTFYANSALTFRVNNKNYTYSFGKPLNYWKSSFFGGLYNWIAPYINNPLAGVQKQWLEVFERHGIVRYKINYRAAILIGVGVPLIIIGLFILVVYIFVIQK